MLAALAKQSQFSFLNGKLRSTTVQTDSKLGTQIDVGIIEVFQAREVNGNLSSEPAAVL